MEKTSKGHSQDLRKVADGQDYEMRYKSKKEGVSPQKSKKGC